MRTERQLPPSASIPWEWYREWSEDGEPQNIITAGNWIVAVDIETGDHWKRDDLAAFICDAVNERMDRQRGLDDRIEPWPGWPTCPECAGKHSPAAMCPADARLSPERSRLRKSLDAYANENATLKQRAAELEGRDASPCGCGSDVLPSECPELFERKGREVSIFGPGQGDTPESSEEGLPKRDHVPRSSNQSDFVTQLDSETAAGDELQDSGDPRLPYGGLEGAVEEIARLRERNAELANAATFDLSEEARAAKLKRHRGWLEKSLHTDTEPVGESIGLGFQCKAGRHNFCGGQHVVGGCSCPCHSADTGQG